MTRDEAMKTAALTLRALSKENIELKESIEKKARAEEIVTKMIKSSQIETEDILSKVAELEKQSVDELKTFEKALEIAKDGTIKLGTISESTSTESMDPLTACVLEDY